MGKINSTIIARTYGIKDKSVVTYTRNYVEDDLRVVTAGDDFTELTTQNIIPTGDPIMVTLSPYLLSLGATYTGVVEQGDHILVYLPHVIDDIDLDQCIIRGYQL